MVNCGLWACLSCLEVTPNLGKPTSCRNLHQGCCFVNFVLCCHFSALSQSLKSNFRSRFRSSEESERGFTFRSMDSRTRMSDGLPFFLWESSLLSDRLPFGKNSDVEWSYPMLWPDTKTLTSRVLLLFSSTEIFIQRCLTMCLVEYLFSLFWGLNLFENFKFVVLPRCSSNALLGIFHLSIVNRLELCGA